MKEIIESLKMRIADTKREIALCDKFLVGGNGSNDVMSEEMPAEDYANLRSKVKANNKSLIHSLTNLRFALYYVLCADGREPKSESDVELHC